MVILITTAFGHPSNSPSLFQKSTRPLPYSITCHPYLDMLYLFATNYTLNYLCSFLFFHIYVIRKNLIPRNSIYELSALLCCPVAEKQEMSNAYLQAHPIDETKRYDFLLLTIPLVEPSFSNDWHLLRLPYKKIITFKIYYCHFFELFINAAAQKEEEKNIHFSFINHENKFDVLLIKGQFAIRILIIREIIYILEIERIYFFLQRMYFGGSQFRSRSYLMYF